MEEGIERYLELPEAAFERPTAQGYGRIRPLGDGGRRYLEYLLETNDYDFKGLKVVVDCANGAASDLGRKPCVGQGLR